MARFDCAVWRPISGGTSGPLTAQRGLVLHHAVAVGSLFGTFNNGAVSTQFWVSRSGLIEQYLDSTSSAWATGSNVGNFQYCSVETEGCNVAPYAEPMSDAMVSALATLYAEGNRRHGWPFQLANSAGANGFAYHRLFFNTACPCDVRVNMRQTILDRARGAPAPPPPATQKGKTMIASTSGMGYWTTTSDGAVYAFGDAEFAGGLFPKKLNAPIIGIAGHLTTGYWLLGADGGIFAFGTAQFAGRPDRT